MANQKLTALSELTTVADDDYVYVVDSSDTTDDPNGSSRKAQAKNIRGWPRTAAETSAGVTPTNYQYEPGNVLRYGTNTTPGTTDMTTAISNAILAVQNRDSLYRGEVYIPAGRYKVTSTLSPADGVDIVGEGRWNTRLEFALTATSDICIDLQGADTSNRIHSTIRKLRIDGTNCTGSSCIGVQCNWNQQQQPILDEVTIYGGYEGGGASTGLANGLVLTEDGSNWTIDFRDVGIEGCYGIQFVADTVSAGAHNVVNFWGGRIHNGKTQNVVVSGPDDDISTVLVNFYGTTMEKGSLNNTGVTAAVQFNGQVLASLNNCWFESNSAPNAPTYDVYCQAGRLVVNSCHFASSLTCLRSEGEVTLTGHNTLRSSTAGVSIGTGGTVNVAGELSFFGGGTPITYASSSSVLNWPRNKSVTKTSNYTVLRSDLGLEFNNREATQNITLTLPLAPQGSSLSFVNGGLNVGSTAYKWTLSGSGTTEYYLELAGGGDPSISEPTKFYRAANARTKGSVGSLADLQWGYGDNDTLGYSTIYYRDSGSDPDSFSDHQLFASYTMTIAPTSFRIVPTGSSGGDSIVDDGSIGNSITLRSDGSIIWSESNKIGTWT